MNSLELMRKAERVLESCQNLDQLAAGRRYARLAERKLRADRAIDLMRISMDLEFTYGKKTIELHATNKRSTKDILKQFRTY